MATTEKQLFFILFSLKALSNKIKNSIKKTLRLASQDGDDREAVALILFSSKAFPFNQEQYKENSSIGEPGGDDREVVALILFSSKAFPFNQEQYKENSSIGQPGWR
ncbi:hypothetical protein [Peribacillus frigoritolerans]|uniref:hypothetical protein n=1 Tax=Peribacillus frigoritolerans TaxID=450367 RepID=UPI001F4F1B2D|nr:hypothetical protein [Peribacillus frigoritolerans]MCK2016745.1 hypothetical protein [Peribacillus frigoritolerans]